jgi:death-on-curing protein
MTVYLSAQQILFIHARLIETTGGEYGVLNLGLLESAVARPQSTFDNKDLYPSLFEKAAALIESLAINHPFLDGNKRTSITASSLFLKQNGYQMQATNEELVEFTFQVINERPSIAEITAWFQHHTRYEDE